MTKLAEIDSRSAERLLESVTLDELAKLWENVLADLQTGPSTQDNELWVEKINEICDTRTKIVGCVFEHLGCSRIPTPGGINNGSESGLLVVTLEK